MVSFIVHALLGLAGIGWIIASNPKIYARPADGPWFSPLECVYYAAGIASIALGWYFNIHFVLDAHGQGEPRSTGPGSYPQLHPEQFANPAAGSGNQDYMIANVILLPVFTIVDGYRRGIRRPWLFFLASFFTSFSFPFAFYFATIERQRTRNQRAARDRRRLGDPGCQRVASAHRRAHSLQRDQRLARGTDPPRSTRSTGRRAGRPGPRPSVHRGGRRGRWATCRRSVRATTWRPAGRRRSSHSMP